MATIEPNDRLEALWRQTAAEIRQKEEELQRLQERFRRLDDARAVIREVEGGLPQAPITARADMAMPTLKEATLAHVRDGGPEGKSPTEIMRGLMNTGYGRNVTERVFYSMVYLTLMRLVEAGEIKAKKGPRGRLFAMKE